VEASAGEAVDRLTVEGLGGLAVADQRLRAGLDVDAQSVPLARVIAESRVTAPAAR
jgi:hypothetical protein